MKTHTYRNYCIFITSQKIVQYHQTPKNPKSDFSETWWEKRENMNGIIRQIRSFLPFTIIIMILVHKFDIEVYLKDYFI